jgi:hypothetical protein
MVKLKLPHPNPQTASRLAFAFLIVAAVVALLELISSLIKR